MLNMKNKYKIVRK